MCYVSSTHSWWGHIQRYQQLITKFIFHNYIVVCLFIIKLPLILLFSYLARLMGMSPISISTKCDFIIRCRSYNRRTKAKQKSLLCWFKQQNWYHSPVDRRLQWQRKNPWLHASCFIGEKRIFMIIKNYVNIVYFRCLSRTNYNNTRSIHPFIIFGCTIESEEQRSLCSLRWLWHETESTDKNNSSMDFKFTRVRLFFSSELLLLKSSWFFDNALRWIDGVRWARNMIIYFTFVTLDRLGGQFESVATWCIAVGLMNYSNEIYLLHYFPFFSRPPSLCCLLTLMPFCRSSIGIFFLCWNSFFTGKFRVIPLTGVYLLLYSKDFIKCHKMSQNNSDPHIPRIGPRIGHYVAYWTTK